MFRLLLVKALQLVEGCPCVRGCPSCTWHTHCPSYNQRLDKGAAMVVLKHILAAEREKDVMALQPEG
jgi:DEAD/DEAH box helicase domain-containing protein